MNVILQAAIGHDGLLQRLDKAVEQVANGMIIRTDIRGEVRADRLGIRLEIPA